MRARQEMTSPDNDLTGKSVRRTGQTQQPKGKGRRGLIQRSLATRSSYGGCSEQYNICTVIIDRAAII